jgi:myosin-5
MAEQLSPGDSNAPACVSSLCPSCSLLPVVWVSGSDGALFSLARVLKCETKSVQVQRLTATHEPQGAEFRTNEAWPANPPLLDGAPDLTQLTQLSEPAVLYNVATRYAQEHVYTYCGQVLIACNPYKTLSALYSRDKIDEYTLKPLGICAPHIFAIAESSYRAMLEQNCDQSILVSGESGAGKTESTKFVMRYLAAMSERAKQSSGSAGAALAAESGLLPIQDRVLESGPLLEAFGNARTLRNDNSSRFGKFIDVLFDVDGVIRGATINTYLLEKSRIPRQSNGERSYHIFYQLLRGRCISDARFGLLAPESYNYLNKSGCYSIHGVDDAEAFAQSSHALSVIGISSSEQDAIWLLLSGVLQLGNARFELDRKENSSISSEPGNPVSRVAQLLDINEPLLRNVLTRRTIVGARETITKSRTIEESEEARDSLAMTLYSRLFEWLVQRINVALSASDSDASSSISFGNRVGVLDIYGFESFEVNSFEQLCINYANEKLQQHFNEHIFKLEQRDYEAEGIDWSYIKFYDNVGCVNLIEAPRDSVLAILDEESRFPKATEHTFVLKLYERLKQNPHLLPEKSAQARFTVRHYAGPVTYTALSFIEKNKDYIIADQVALLGASGNPVVAHLFTNQQRPQPSEPESEPHTRWSAPPAPIASPRGNALSGSDTPENSPRKPPLERKNSFQLLSVASQFKLSLQDLMRRIERTAPMYVRCVKPNALKQAGVLDGSAVLHQLRCGGVFECIRISKAGYPTRRSFAEFVQRYGCLLRGPLHGNARELCIAILRVLSTEPARFLLGKTRVFLKAGELGVIEKRRIAMRTSAATRIQSLWRTHRARRSFLQLRIAALRIQCNRRMVLAVREVQSLRREHASRVIQSQWRSFAARTRFVQIRSAAISLQSLFRRRCAILALQTLRRERAARAVQHAVRGWLVRAQYSKLRQAAVHAQTLWRGKLARRELRALRLEARDIGNLQARTKSLEELVAQLRNELSRVTDDFERVEQERGEAEARAIEAEQMISAYEQELSDRQTMIASLSADKAELERISSKRRDSLDEMLDLIPTSKSSPRASVVDADELDRVLEEESLKKSALLRFSIDSHDSSHSSCSLSFSYGSDSSNASALRDSALGSIARPSDGDALGQLLNDFEEIAERELGRSQESSGQHAQAHEPTNEESEEQEQIDVNALRVEIESWKEHCRSLEDYLADLEKRFADLNSLCESQSLALTQRLELSQPNVEPSVEPNVEPSVEPSVEAKVEPKEREINEVDIDVSIDFIAEPETGERSSSTSEREKVCFVL